MAFAIIIQKFIIDCSVSVVALDDQTIDQRRDKVIEVQSFFISVEMAIILMLLTAEFRIRENDITQDDASESMTFDTKEMETPEKEKLRFPKQHNN